MGGLFCGEGYIMLSKRRNRKGNTWLDLQCRIQNTDIELLLPFQRNFGYKIHLQAKAGRKMGNATARRDVFTWYILGHKAYAFLRWIFPFLYGRKRQKALEVMHIWEIKHPGAKKLMDALIHERSDLKMIYASTKSSNITYGIT